MFAALATCAARRLSAEADEARAKAENLRRGGGTTIASLRERADAQSAAAADINANLASADPATVHPLFAALATCAARRLSAEADEARTKAEKLRRGDRPTIASLRERAAAQSAAAA